MLMRAASYRGDAVEVLAQKTLQGGQNGILRLAVVPNRQSSEAQDSECQ
jgi:hypothetical protein